MPRPIDNMSPDKWDFFRDVFGVSSDIRWVDADQDNRLDVETELVRRGGPFDCGCSTCDVSVSYWTRAVIRGNLERMRNLSLFDETYADAYRRLKTGRCEERICLREETKEGLEILGKAKNPRVVKAMERLFRGTRQKHPSQSTLFISWFASQAILMGEAAKAKEWILELNRVSNGTHPVLTSLAAGALKLVAEKQNVRQGQDLLEKIPPFFAGGALFGFAVTDNCKNKEALEQMASSYLEKHPRVASAHAAKGYLAGLCFKAPREGLKAFNRALNLEGDLSKRADYFLMQGLIYARAKLYEKALAKIGKASELDASPESQIKYHEIRAETYLAAQNFEEAKKAFEQVLLATSERKFIRNAERGLLEAYKGLERLNWKRYPSFP